MASPQMPHIGAVWAFLSIDADGDEGVCAFVDQSGGAPTWMAMVCADEARVESLKVIARTMAKTGTPIRLVKFTERQDLETFGE